jgi:SAM-dependent methyltransferase
LGTRAEIGLIFERGFIDPACSVAQLHLDVLDILSKPVPEGLLQFRKSFTLALRLKRVRAPRADWIACPLPYGNPRRQAGRAPIQPGETVVDLGCRGGADVCVAALLIGRRRHVIAGDVTPAMVEKARANAKLNVGPSGALFSNNLVLKPRMFLRQSVYVLRSYT